MDQDYSQQAQQADDDRLFVKFYMGTRKNEERTAEAGHPVFDDVPFIRIIVPGDKNTIIDTVADENYKRRFSRLWGLFIANQEQTHSGMPIEQWAGITRSVAEELKYINIHTVEQLASAADSVAQKIMGFHDLKRKANVFLEQAKDSALAQKLSDQLKLRDDEISGLRSEIARLSQLFEQITAGKVAVNVEQLAAVNSPNRRK